MKRILIAVHIVLLALLGQACGVEYQQTVKNTPTGEQTRALLGEWRSAGPTSFANPQTCGDLKWNVTSQDATRMAGNFEATCAGGVKLVGTASGYIDGNLYFDATGTATGLVPVSCPFTLTGTGTLQADSTLRVQYIGTTCAGNISGTEILRR